MTFISTLSLSSAASDILRPPAAGLEHLFAAFIFIADSSHFGTAGQEAVERTARSDASVLKKEYLSRSAQSGSPSTDNEKCRFSLARQAAPELLLRRDVERAREVVNNQQVGTSREHACGTHAVDLAARELHAARTH